MPCTKHSPFRRRKGARTSEPYQRWEYRWTPAADQSEGQQKPHANVLPKRGSHYIFFKTKIWSFLYLRSDPKDLTEIEFNNLVEQWRRDTFLHSSLSKKVTHPAYVTIMACGKNVLPFVLRELEKNPDHWFYALRYIARRDIASGTTTFDDARSAWLKWGKQNNYI